VEVKGTALVLGAGGVTGVGWEVGLLFGLLEAGVDLSTAELVIGTSAGSVVAAQLCSGTPLAELYERQLQPASSELSAKLGAGTLLCSAWAMLRARDAASFRRRMGELALGAKTVGEADRKRTIASRLPSLEWPARALRIGTVNARTGEFLVLDAASGVALLDAVSASCAVPGVWPPVTIGSERFIDGGMRSATNADLAANFPRVAVLAPISEGIGPMQGLAPQVQALRETGSIVAFASPDAAARRQMGRNTLDPRKRADSARAGRAQAKLVAKDFADAWAGSAS
jgi:NTE family protein